MATAPPPPPLPLLHTHFRSSVATSASIAASHPFPFSYDSHDADGVPTSQLRFIPPPISVDLVPSSASISSCRAPVQYLPSTSTNFSRPHPPRSPESEREKHKVLKRVNSARFKQSATDHKALSATGISPKLHAVATVPSNVGNRPQVYNAPPLDPLYLDSQPTNSSHMGSSSYILSSSQDSDSSSPQSDSRYPLTPTADRSEDQPTFLSYEQPYDRYSFYEFPSPLPSPTHPKLAPSSLPAVLPLAIDQYNPESPNVNSSTDKTAEDYLTLGINTHMKDSVASLKQSAKYFEAAATVNGGCGFGMLLWGLCLRHGWGIMRDEAKAFVWLKKSCELAVGDLEGLNTLKALPDQVTLDSRGVQAELILAIYEVGQCFFQGWGVPRDRAMGFNYFLMAARLGDMDAQLDVGYCYSNGKGCKKDRSEAAKWYRAAVEQGASPVGLAWIYKEKFKLLSH